MGGWTDRHTYGGGLNEPEGGQEGPALKLPFHSSLLRTAFLLLLLVSATWLLGLLAVNSDTLSFHYLFAAFSCLQVGASSYLLGSLCDLCPGAALVRRRWRRALVCALAEVVPALPSPASGP